MILLQGMFRGDTRFVWGLISNGNIDKFDMAEALVVFMHSVTLHGEDILSHTNWEIGERFLYQFPYVSFLCYVHLSLTMALQDARRPICVRYHQQVETRARGEGADSGRHWTRLAEKSCPSLANLC